MRSLSALLLVGILHAGTEPKAKPEDYPLHAAGSKVAIGAEYMVHSFTDHNNTFVTRDHLVVEVAIFPGPGAPLMVSLGNFSLRVNGKKAALAAQAPEFVSASLKYNNWEQHPTLTGSGGLGNAGVVLGQPRPNRSSTHMQSGNWSALALGDPGQMEPLTLPGIAHVRQRNRLCAISNWI
jgi:hypothetical protein